MHHVHLSIDVFNVNSNEFEGIFFMPICYGVKGSTFRIIKELAFTFCAVGLLDKDCKWSCESHVEVLVESKYLAFMK
jgi:hypothetical protein